MSAFLTAANICGIISLLKCGVLIRVMIKIQQDMATEITTVCLPMLIMTVNRSLYLVDAVLDVNGTVIDNTPAPANNFLIYWDGDLEREILDGVDISKMTSATRISNIFSADGCSANNASKNVPCLSADIFGDWREELFVRTADNSALFFTVYNRYCRLLLSKYGCLGGVSICLHYRSNYK
jgi:hypothetical protein